MSFIALSALIIIQCQACNILVNTSLICHYDSAVLSSSSTSLSTDHTLIHKLSSSDESLKSSAEWWAFRADRCADLMLYSHRNTCPIAGHLTATHECEECRLRGLMVFVGGLVSLAFHLWVSGTRRQSHDCRTGVRVTRCLLAALMFNDFFAHFLFV